jgi:hypothetical protein
MRRRAYFPTGRVSIDLGRRRRTGAKVAPLGVCYSLSYACDDVGIEELGTTPRGFGALAHDRVPRMLA